MTREMKCSGVEWIGDIPREWKIRKIKNVCSLYTGNSIKDNEKNNFTDSTNAIPYIATKEIDVSSSKINYDNGMYVKKYDENFKVAPKHSTLMCIEGGSAGKKNAYLNQEVCFVNKLCCFSTKTMNDKFLHFYLKSPSFNAEFNLHISGLIGGVSQGELKEFSIAIPPLSEQYKIADFLDSKVSEIDKIITETKSNIENYKEYKQSVITEAVTKGLDKNVPMKDSGIEYIPEIPLHWSIEKGKHILSLLARPVKEDDEVITCFRDGEVTLRKNRREEGFTFSLKEIGYQGIEVGDLVVHGMDGFAGAIGISDARGKASPVLNVLNTNYNKRYIMYYLRSLAFNNVFTSLATGIRVRSCDLRWNKLADVMYVVPTIYEQEKIADYIDEKCIQIDTVISEKEKFITIVEEYKKSLIYEYVTGKKEVKVAKNDENIVAFTPVYPAVYNTKKARFAQAVLMSKILAISNNNKGRVKLEKTLYTIEHHIGFDFETEYTRDAAGPLDKSIYDCEGIISRRNKWFNINSSNYGVSYKPTKNVNKYKNYYNNYFADYNTEIERIIRIFDNFNTDQAEIIATLYGSWNDFIIDNKTFTDDDVVNDILNNWHDSKRRFSKDVWIRAMGKMRTLNLVPKGYGKKTVRKEV